MAKKRKDPDELWGTKKSGGSGSLPSGYEKSSTYKKYKSKSAVDKLWKAAYEATKDQTKEQTSRVLNEWNNPNVYYSAADFERAQRAKRQQEANLALQKARTTGSASPLSQLGDAYNRYSRENPVSVGTQQAMAYNAEQRARDEAMKQYLNSLDRSSPGTQQAIEYNNLLNRRDQAKERQRAAGDAAFRSAQFGLNDIGQNINDMIAARDERQALNNYIDYRKQADATAFYNSLASRPDYRQHTGNNADPGALESLRGSYDRNHAYYSDVDPAGNSRLVRTSSADTELSAEEIANYEYIYSTMGKNAADDYLNSLKIDNRRAAKHVEDWRQMANESPVAATLLTTFTSPITNLQAAVGDITDIVFGNGIQTDTNASNAGLRAKQAVNQTVSENIGKSLADKGGPADSGYRNFAEAPWQKTDSKPATWADIGQTLYSAAVSAGDSTMSMLVGSASGWQDLGTLLMSLGAGHSALQQAKARGATDGQAIWLSIVSAGAEYVSEHMSSERIIDAVSLKRTADAFVGTLFKGIAAEELEETTSAVIEWLADQVIMGKNSEFNRAVEAAKAQGYSDEEARDMAWQVFGSQMVETWKQTAISTFMQQGGAMAVGQMTGRLSPEVQRGMEIYQTEGPQGVSDLLDDAAFYKIIDQNAADQLRNDIIWSTRDGRQMSIEQAARLSAIESQVQAERNNENVSEPAQMDTGYTGRTQAERMAAVQPTRTLEEAAQAVAEAQETQREVSPVQESVRAAAPSVQAAQTVQAQTQQTAQAQDIENTRNLDQLARMAQTFKDDRTRNAYISGYQQGQDVATYTTGFNQILNAAQNGETSISTIIRNNAEAQTLSNSAQRLAFFNGQNIANEQRAQEDVESAEAGNVVLSISDAARRQAERRFGGRQGFEAQMNILSRMAERSGTVINVVDHIRGDNNGFLRTSTNQITVALDAQGGAYVWTAGHEVGHFIKDNNAGEFDIISGMVKSWMAEKNVDYDALVNSYVRQSSMDEIEAGEEVICDHLGAFFASEKYVSELAESKEGQSILKRFANVLKDILSDIKRSIATIAAERNYGSVRALNEDAEAIEKMYESINAALETASENYQQKLTDRERNRIANEQTDTAGEIKNSTRLDMTLMDNAEAYAERTGYKNVEKAVLDTVSKQRQQLADYLIKNEDRLGLPEDVAGNTIWANGSYGKTVENSLICPRSMSAQEFCAAVSEELGRPLTQEEGIYVSQAAAAYVHEAQCLYCYVAMDRLAYNEYMGKYIDARETAIRDVIEKGMPTNEAYEKYLDGRKDTKNQKARFHSWIRAARNGEELITKADLASTDAMARAIARNPQLQAQINDVRKYSQSASWAKKQQGYRAYNGNILKMSDAAIKKLNQMYGLRMYSFSDYSPAYVLENMQMITDAAVKGAKVLAYTKSLDFVKTFGSTGAAINISVFAFDGKSKGIIEDQMYGAPWEEAKALRAQYPNVGITFTATNDALVEWGLQQDWIDVVIPFHLVKTGKVVADLLGYTNFTSESSDIKASDWTKGRDASSITPSMHHNDKEAYLEACRENHLEPRFKRWIDHDGYMKLVNETRLSADEIQVVQPVFNDENMKAAFDSLKNLEKVGGYTQHVGGNVENMRDIAEETADEVRNGAVEKFREFNRRYSIQERIKNNESVGMGRLFDAEETSLTERELINYNKFVENALKGKGYNNAPYIKTGEVSKQISNGLNKFGINLSKNAEHRITDNNIRHIRSSHGIEADGPVGITDGDIYAIPFILANPDGAYYRETSRGLKGIVYVLNDVDTTYYVEGILENGELTGRQMIKTKLGEVPYQYRNDITKEKALIGLTDDNGLNSKTEAPRSYVQAVTRDRASDNSIQQNDKGVKSSTPVDMSSTPVDMSTPQLDRAYSEAATDNNEVAAAELVKEAARRAGYTVHAYHGTPNGTFNTFNNWQYFTTDKAYADVYQNQGASSNGYKKTATNRKTYDTFLKMEKSFDTRNAAEQKIFMDEFYQKWGNGTPLSERGLPDWTDGDDLIEFFEENGYDYDAIILDEGGTGGYGDKVNDRGISYVIKDSSQIKSADPFTYDDEGNLIPLSERFNPKNNDIRYSTPVTMTPYSETEVRNSELLQKRVEKLQAVNEILRNEFKLTKGVKLSEQAIRSMATKLINQYHLTSGKNQSEKQEHLNQLTQKLNELFTYMASRDEQVTWDEVYKRGMEIARREIEQASYFDKETWDHWSDFRKSISGTIRISEQAAKDVKNKYDTLDGYYKATGIRLSMSSGYPIDSLFIELAGKYGTGSFPLDMTEPDMPEMLAEVKDRMSKDNMYVQTYAEEIAFDNEEAAHDLFLTMIDAYYDIPEVETFADKKDRQFKQMRARYKTQIAELRQEAKDRYAEVKKQLKAEFAKERADLALAYAMNSGRKIAQVKRTYQEGMDRIIMDDASKLSEAKKKAAQQKDAYLKQFRDRYRELASAEYQKRRELIAAQNKWRADQSWTLWETGQENKYKDKITKTAKALRDYLESPDFKTGKYIPDDLKRPVVTVLEGIDFTGRRGGQAQQQAWLDRMKSLRDYVDKIQESEYAVDLPGDFKAAFQDYITMLETRQDLKINDMMSGELRQLDYLLSTLRHAIKNQNELMANARTASVAKLAQETVDYANTHKEYRDGGMIKKYLDTDSIDAITFFQRLGKAGESIGQAIIDGLNKAYGLIRKASNDIADIKKRIGVTDREMRRWADTRHQIKLESGAVVYMTVPQVMDFVAASRRPQGLQHILGGGVKINDIGTGLKKLQQKRTYAITETDVQNISKLLTDKQDRLISALQMYLSTEHANSLNEVSQKLYGVRNYLEQNYWPISSDGDTLKIQDPDKLRAYNAIQNSSFTKATNRYANNAITITDAFDRLVDHITSGAKYYGLTIPVADAQKWYNAKLRDENGDLIRDGEVARAINLIAGKAGQGFYSQLIKDINGLNPGQVSTNITSKLLSHAKAAAVAGKLRVVIQQPTALPKAAIVIPAKYIVKTTIGPRPINEMLEHSPIAWWKSNGNWEIGTGQSMKSVLVGGEKVMDKVQEAFMKPAGFADDVTWAHMWAACKAWVEDTTSLEKGSDEYWAEVDKRFTKTVMETQVVDTVMTRTQSMRDRNDAVKQYTSFMSEPLKSYNLVLRAWERVVNADSEAARKTAYKFAAKTAVASLLTTVLNAAVTASFDVSRKRDKEKEWLEQFKETFGDYTMRELIPGSNVPVLADMTDILYNFLKEGKLKFETPSDLRFTAIETAVKTLEAWDKYINHKAAWSDYKLFSQTAKVISDLAGLPFGGTLTSIEQVYNIMSNYLGGTEINMQSEYATMATAYQNMYKYLTADNRKAYQDLYDLMLKKKLEKNPDERKAKNEIFKGIRDILVEQDERIAELAEMRFNNNIDSARYKVLKNQLVSEGFTWEMVNGAVNSKVEQLKEESSEEKETKEWSPSEFENSDLYGSIEDALNTGDYSAADMVYESILEFSRAQDPVTNTKKNIWEEFRDQYLSEVSAGKGKNYAAMFIRFGYTEEELNNKLTDYAWNTYRLTYFEERDKGIDKTGAMLRKIGLTQKQLDNRYKQYLSDKKKKN